MNISEANAVNVLLYRLYGQRGTVTRDEVDKAARLLVAKSHKALGAGITEQQLEAAIVRRNERKR